MITREALDAIATALGEFARISLQLDNEAQVQIFVRLQNTLSVSYRQFQMTILDHDQK